MIFYTPLRVRRLQGKANEAKRKIGELFTGALITIDREGCGWGQFLDERRTNDQHGIYGTSSGVQVLTLLGYPETNEIMVGASKVLQRAREQDSRFFRKGDLSVIYKICHLADAAHPGYEETDDDVMEEIVDKMLPGQGWGEYFSTADRDPEPKVISTALALLSLRRYRPFRSDPKCRQAVQWLCSNIGDNPPQRLWELGISVLALCEYRDVGVHITNFRSTLETCEERLIQLTRVRKKTQIGLSEAHNYSVSWGGCRVNRYLWFLPDCIAALAFLRLDCPLRARSYLLRVVDYFASKVVENGFAGAVSGRLSSVDHLWIFRLLNEFASRSPDTLVPPSNFRWLVASTPIRVISTISFLGLIILGGWLTERPDATAIGFWGTLGAKNLGTVLSSIGVAGIGVVLTLFLEGRKS